MFSIMMGFYIISVVKTIPMFQVVKSMAISGTDLLEVPTIYNSGLNFREYPHRIWPDK